MLVSGLIVLLNSVFADLGCSAWLLSFVVFLLCGVGFTCAFGCGYHCL